MDDEEMIASMRRCIASDPFVALLGTALPECVVTWPHARLFQFCRVRIGLSQKELAERGGLAQSQISHLESGRDCRLSTWTRVYAALGLELRLIPVSRVPEEELRRRADGLRNRSHLAKSLRPHGPWFRPRSTDRAP